MEKHFNAYAPISGNLIYEELNEFYGSIKKELAISHFAELIDTHQHSTTRDVVKIKTYINQRNQKAFVFIICLN